MSTRFIPALPTRSWDRFRYGGRSGLRRTSHGASSLAVPLLTLFISSSQAPGQSCTTDANCDDGVWCTLDQCFNAICRFLPVSAACDDGLYCNGAETCHVTLDCQPGSPPCVGDSCAEATDECFCNADADCDDGIFCNGAERCDGVLGCRSGTPPLCNDGWPCTDDACDEEANRCTYTSTCDDGFACTNDYCMGTAGCMYFAQPAFCDDGLFCNGVETCNPATGDPITGCKAATVSACYDGLPCTGDACNESTNSCTRTLDHSQCDDGVACTLDLCNVTDRKSVV